MQSLENHIVVVTGAGSGIGRATARAFARERAKVHVVDVDTARTQETVDLIQNAGDRATAHVVDCSDGAAVEQLAEEVYQADGRVDVLHNNAGVAHASPVAETSLEDWRWIVGINYWGVVHGVRAFVPRMIRQGGGAHIVNTASMTGLVGIPHVVPYTTTKFAVVGLSESLSVELAPHGIAVTALCPGMVRTNVMQDGRMTLPGNGVALLERIMARFALEPDQVANDVLRVVRRGRGGIKIVGRDVWPLYGLKRLSAHMYQAMWREITRHVLARTGAATS